MRAAYLRLWHLADVPCRTGDDIYWVRVTVNPSDPGIRTPVNVFSPLGKTGRKNYLLPKPFR